MSNQTFLDSMSEIFHMTDCNNLQNILLHGLQNHYNTYKQVDISNQEVNARREKIEFIYGHKIHDYVPFYFNPRNAMLYRNRNNARVIILGLDVWVIKDHHDGFLVSNRNASADEAKFSKYLPDLQDQNFINFDDVFSLRWCNNGIVNNDIKQKMMAEILINDIVYSRYIHSIYVKDQVSKKAIEEQLAGDLKMYNINVIVDLAKFF
ncbi:DarT ssDNA thymidine ADP-ribosyltransferase family protein [Campylobacter concisus]|uniref:DarT ssDNA thymidine ADP-ribosyltransferase family protein n=1 Tax=Campylobacter concisus TaxID=199 RepID=UPI00165FAA66|nr:DarT ssDNA thymidine ADP-ribosyltransferase family protein [Campylobacter concisus]